MLHSWFEYLNISLEFVESYRLLRIRHSFNHGGTRVSVINCIALAIILGHAGRELVLRMNRLFYSDILDDQRARN